MPFMTSFLNSTFISESIFSNFNNINYLFSDLANLVLSKSFFSFCLTSSTFIISARQNISLTDLCISKSSGLIISDSTNEFLSSSHFLSFSNTVALKALLRLQNISFFATSLNISWAQGSDWQLVNPSFTPSLSKSSFLILSSNRCNSIIDFEVVVDCPSTHSHYLVRNNTNSGSLFFSPAGMWLAALSLSKTTLITLFLQSQRLPSSQTVSRTLRSQGWSLISQPSQLPLLSPLLSHIGAFFSFLCLVVELISIASSPIHWESSFFSNKSSEFPFRSSKNISSKNHEFINALLKVHGALIISWWFDDPSGMGIFGKAFSG